MSKVQKGEKKKKDEKEQKSENQPSQLMLENVITSVNASCGENTLQEGAGYEWHDRRIPSGIFSVDYVLGGGWPLYGSSCLWGPESGGKSFIALHTMKIASLLCWECWKPLDTCLCERGPRKMRSCYVSVEGTLDADWVADIGLQKEDYVVALADSGEQAINVAEAALRAMDCGLVVFDSLGSLISEAEFEAPSEDKFIGNQAALITKAVKKIKLRLIREQKKRNPSHPCAILFINQLRTKIGMMHGDPDTMTGGHAMFHEFSVTLRCTKKALLKDGVDAKFFDKDEGRPLASRHAFSLRKDKIWTIGGPGEFVVIKKNIEELELTPGMVDDYSTVLKQAKEYEVLTKEGDVWVLWNGSKAKLLEDIKTYWKRYPNEYLKAKMEIISRARARIGSRTT